jgi:predicted alpha-1,2-mannosidase
MDRQIRTKPEHMDHIYTDLSIWDVHRTQIPFIVFHDSQRANDIIHSIMLEVEQGGDLPKWPLANGYTGCMIGSHADVLISDLIMKKEHNQYLNLTQVAQALRKVANQNQVHDGREDPPTYIQYEYLPSELDRQGAPLTLSYAYDDWAIGNVMNAIGLVDEAKEYYRRSTWFEHVFDNKTKFFCPKDKAGKFDCPSNEIEFLNPFDNRYVEGDAWHYRFFVPHNTSRLVELLGGRDYFIEQLNIFFERGQAWTTNLLPNPYYWPGNEHDLFSVWQFNYANRSDLTQKYSRWLITHAYTSKPDGLPGNDDYGTMSAWYLFTSMGFYPLAGSSTYLIGSPAFDTIKISRNNGSCILSINVHNNSETNIYVERVLLNGESLSTFPFIDHINHLKCSNNDNNQSNIQLDFFMSSTPSFSFDK